MHLAVCNAATGCEGFMTLCMPFQVELGQRGGPQTWKTLVLLSNHLFSTETHLFYLVVFGF